MGDDPSDPPTSIPNCLDRDVLKAAAMIRERYPNQIVDRRTAERITRLFRAGLIPRGKAGSPLSESVKIALPMRERGEQWQNIYQAALPGYRTMDKYERQGRCSSLRLNVNRALRRRAAKAEDDSAAIR